MNNFLKDLEYLKISPHSTLVEKLNIYANLLIAENRVQNLTTVTDKDEIFSRHFADSLALCGMFENHPKFLASKSLDFAKDFLTILDVGSGAGFPGIPLAAQMPLAQVTMLETLEKRCRFLTSTIESLLLRNITVANGRAEDLAKTEKRESFDIVTARAVAPLNILLEFCLPFVKNSGLFCAYKGSDCHEELALAENALLALGGQYLGNFDYALPSNNIKRSILVFEKVHQTPEKYPRKAGKPKKSPL